MEKRRKSAVRATAWVCGIGGLALILRLLMLPFLLMMLRVGILNTVGAFTVPEWGSLSLLIPQEKVELVDGCSEVAGTGTMADGKDGYYDVSTWFSWDWKKPR